MNARDRMDPLCLSVREYDVLSLIARGESAKRIAAELGIAMSSVKHHVTNARKKLGARNTPHAAVLFDRANRSTTA
jgi:DNA-binding CsgD family transcriptional regulator